MVTEKEKSEAISILKDLEKEKCEYPDKEKDILKWTLKELKTYILKETKGMSPLKKIKFARRLNKTIAEKKKKLKT